MKKQIARILLYFLGLFLLSGGTVFSALSGLGINATTSLGYVISLHRQISLGKVTGVMFSIYIIFQLVFTRRKDYIRILLQFPFSLIFMTLLNLMMGRGLLEADGLFLKLLFLLISSAMTALGALLVIHMKITPTAPDGFIDVFSQITGKSLGFCKVLSDILLVLAAVVFCLVTEGKLYGLGVGTGLSAVLTGLMISLLEKPLCGLLGTASL